MCFLMCCAVLSHTFLSSCPFMLTLPCSLPLLTSPLHLLPALSSTTLSIILLLPSSIHHPLHQSLPHFIIFFFLHHLPLPPLSSSISSSFIRQMFCKHFLSYACIISPPSLSNFTAHATWNFSLFQLGVCLCARLKWDATFSFLYYICPLLKCKQR